MRYIITAIVLVVSSFLNVNCTAFRPQKSNSNEIDTNTIKQDEMDVHEMDMYEMQYEMQDDGH